MKKLIYLLLFTFTLNTQAQIVRSTNPTYFNALGVKAYNKVKSWFSSDEEKKEVPKKQEKQVDRGVVYGPQEESQSGDTRPYFYSDAPYISVNEPAKKEGPAPKPKVVKRKPIVKDAKPSPKTITPPSPEEPKKVGDQEPAADPADKKEDSVEDPKKEEDTEIAEQKKEEQQRILIKQQLAVLSTTSVFSSECLQTKSIEGKASWDGEINCNCAKGTTLDYNSCLDLIHTQNQFKAAQKATEVGTIAVLETQKNESLEELNTKGNDFNKTAYEAGSNMAETRTYSNAIISANNQQNSLVLNSILSSWPTSQNFIEKCTKALSELRDEDIDCEKLSQGLGAHHFSNTQAYMTAINSKGESQKNTIEAAKAAFASNNQKKVSDQFKVEYDGATKVGEDPYFCFNNPEMCAGKSTPVAETVLPASDTNNFSGGAIILDEQASSGEVFSDSGVTVTYAEDDSTELEGQLPEAIQAKFETGLSSLGGSGSIASAGSANGEAIKTPSSRQAKLDNKDINVEKIDKELNKKKMGSKGFRKIASSKEQSLNYINPLAGLFKSGGETKNQIGRALSNDGVIMESKEGKISASLFMRISRVHQRKIEKREFQSL